RCRAVGLGVRPVHLLGLDRLHAITRVVQRARLAEPEGGVWEAADVQWWWRRARPTDDIPLPVWTDDAGPCAAVSLVDWGDRWQADLFVAPGTTELGEMWASLMSLIDQYRPPSVEVFMRDDDRPLIDRVLARGFGPAGEPEPILWMDTDDRPAVAAADGFRIIDRASTGDVPHPMVERNGEQVETRLRQCSLYDAA